VIEAKHSRLARALFNPYCNHILKKSFSGFNLVEEIPQLPEDRSLLITPNHFSWWDGFFIDYLLRKVGTGTRNHVMMLEEQLQKYPFFSKVGAYSIDTGNRKDILASIRYTCSLLGNPGNAVVLYPQGELLPWDTDPFEVKDGIRLISKMAGEHFAILPLVFRIEYRNKRKPEVICSPGEILDGKLPFMDFEMFKGKLVNLRDKTRLVAQEDLAGKDIFHA
jgi:1-acyl-sn-glycerol-3-phosphate acyltransferase